MAYYVLGEYGQKYGPAEVHILNLWICEGRIAPVTMLEDESTGTQIVASAVDGLQFASSPNPMLGNQIPYQAPQYQPQPYQQVYQPQPVYGTGLAPGEAQFKRARTLCLVSLVLTLIIPLAGIAAAIASFINAIMAKDARHPNSLVGMMYGGGALLFWALIELLKMGWI